MKIFKIDNKDYNISEGYNFSRSAWVLPLSDSTKELLLDYTIMWNMVEHQVYDDAFNKKEKTDKCINNVLEDDMTIDKVNYIYDLFKKYISKFNTYEEFYRSFIFIKSGIAFEEIEQLLNSDDIKDKLRLLIYSCYRVRCNFFHGPKCILDLDDQNLLFLAMNELLSLISKAYGM